MASALVTFHGMQQAGSDPLQILQDMCEFVHLLTKGQVIADYAKNKTLAEFDRKLLTELSNIKVPALARAWQILLKGITEVQSAPHPGQAAEMVLIRVSYAAELPPPADLIKQLRESGAASAAIAPSTPSNGGGPAPRAKLASRGGAVLTPAIATQAIPQAETALSTAPTNFRDLVALFGEKREGGLHGQLYSNVNLVRYEQGMLEINVGPSAPANLAARLGQCLTEWTGQRWMVSISTGVKGQPTLAEQDKAAAQKRQEKALSHPLVQAVSTAFPGAKMSSLKQKTVVPVAAAEDDVDISVEEPTSED
jgi:DNA polymerase III subunit gamma/tau